MESRVNLSLFRKSSHRLRVAWGVQRPWMIFAALSSVGVYDTFCARINATKQADEQLPLRHRLAPSLTVLTMHSWNLAIVGLHLWTFNPKCIDVADIIDELRWVGRKSKQLYRLLWSAVAKKFDVCNKGGLDLLHFCLFCERSVRMLTALRASYTVERLYLIRSYISGGIA